MRFDEGVVVVGDEVTGAWVVGETVTEDGGMKKTFVENENCEVVPLSNI